MTQLSLASSDRHVALTHFGYTEREATFLCLAALHSGYFLRRHYRAFLGQEDGGVIAQLIDKAFAMDHMRAFTFRYKTQIYHLGSRPFYSALAQMDNRNRRQHEPITIKTRLMALDFVLAHRSAHFLATEQEKVKWFASTVERGAAILPTKRYCSKTGDRSTERYFVEKFPIFLSDAASSRPIITFVFVDPGSTTLAGFETFLLRYRPLFETLDGVSVVYVSEYSSRSESARKVFERVVTCRAARHELPRLLQYFEAKRALEANDFASLDRTKLIQLRNDRQEFSTREHDGLYALWQQSGSEAVADKLIPKSNRAAASTATFSTYVLEHSYDIFGHIIGY